MRRKFCAFSLSHPARGAWIEISITSVDLYRAALAKGVAICPGDPFYEIDRGVHTVRLNYSNSTDEIIEKGMKLLGEACAELLGK